MSLVEKVFLDGGDETLNKLLKDEDVKKLILKEVAKELPDYEGIITKYPNEQIMAIVLDQSFADMDECFYVGNMIIRYMKKGLQLDKKISEEKKTSSDILPSLVYQKGIELAEKGFIGLCFFYECLEHKSNRHGAPSPEYFKSVSKTIFVQEGWPTLASNIDNWQDCLHYQFDLVNLNADLNKLI
jgi:hypothetical protein|tara:strand:+ start:1381 stop:1935 length:555 start_codon:yes stop_codon:yes gene_type:complete